MKDSTHEIQLLQHMEQTSAMLEAIGDQVGDDEHGVPLLSRHRPSPFHRGLLRSFATQDLRARRSP
jgi:hypothetical protein